MFYLACEYSRLSSLPAPMGVSLAKRPSGPGAMRGGCIRRLVLIGSNLATSSVLHIVHLTPAVIRPKKQYFFLSEVYREFGEKTMKLTRHLTLTLTLTKINEFLQFAFVEWKTKGTTQRTWFGVNRQDKSFDVTEIFSRLVFDVIFRRERSDDRKYVCCSINQSIINKSLFKHGKIHQEYKN